MKLLFRPLIILVLVIFPLTGALAAPVAWTNWTAASGSYDFAEGSLTLGAETVVVQFAGRIAFAQTSGGGTNYWNPSAPYISATVPNAPPDSDIIGLGAGGSAIIAFSRPVQDPLIALVSWNGNTVEFGVPINILSYGHGYWGDGTPVLNPGGTGFYGSGEVHGVIELPGVYSSITFSHTSEDWHGLTVGARDIAPAPLPSSLVLLGSGFFALVGLRHRRKN